MKGLAIILAVVFVIAAVVSVLHPLAPSPLTSALGFSNDKPHLKHPVLYLVLAVLSLVWLRFQSAQPAR
jgi:hypothetical protein